MLGIPNTANIFHHNAHFDTVSLWRHMAALNEVEFLQLPLIREDGSETFLKINLIKRAGFLMTNRAYSHTLWRLSHFRDWAGVTEGRSR